MLWRLRKEDDGGVEFLRYRFRKHSTPPTIRLEYVLVVWFCFLLFSFHPPLYFHFNYQRRVLCDAMLRGELDGEKFKSKTHTHSTLVVAPVYTY
jgi:hypothetical protein